MRLGVAEGPVPHDPAQVDERLGAKLRELGVDGVFAHFGYGSGATPDDVDHAVFERARDLLQMHGVRVVQSWGWDVNFVHPDRDVRARHLDRFRSALTIAELLGADGVTMDAAATTRGGSTGRTPRTTPRNRRRALSPASRRRARWPSSAVS